MKIIFLGITQGLTEFLPISSSAHLYIVKKYLGLEQGLLAFFVFLHLATLLAIIIFLYREIISALLQRQVLIHLAIISVVTAAVGLIIDVFLTGFFEKKFWIPFLLFVNGIMLLSVKKVSGYRNYDSITLRDSLILGLLQGIAVFPGISRAGLTIVGLLKRGFRPQAAFNFSFLMALPVILGAFLLKTKDLTKLTIPISDMLLGFIAAFTCGLLALFVVKKTLIQKRFSVFGYYCILVSLVSLII